MRYHSKINICEEERPSVRRLKNQWKNYFAFLLHKMEKLMEFTAAVRGYHHYMKHWQPTENECLDCGHEEDNPYDYFAIKTCQRPTGKIVGHLPIEISRSTKFLLDRGARITATLSSTSYYRSPLVQGGLEIPCLVEVFMPRTIKNKELISKYREMVEMLYQQTDGRPVLGNILVHGEATDSQQNIAGEEIEDYLRKGTKRQNKAMVQKTKPVTEGRNVKNDIRSFFKKSSPSATISKPALLQTNSGNIADEAIMID